MEGGGRVAIGVALAAGASSMNAVGLNLQRVGQRQKGKSWLNGLGVLLATSSGILDLVSFGFAPQAVLAPLCAVSLVANLALAPLMHGEPLAGIDLVATALVCAGVVVSLAFASGEATSYSLSDLERLSRRPVFLTYAVVYAAVVAALVAHIYTGERQGRGSSKAVAVGYPILSGLLGGMTNLHAKLMTELFKLVSFETHGPLLAAVIGLVAFFAITQVAVLNRGVGKHSSLFVVPLASASFLLANLSSGMAFFDELSAFSRFQLQGFAAGVALVLAGVAALSTKGLDAGGPGHKAAKTA